MRSPSNTAALLLVVLLGAACGDDGASHQRLATDPHPFDRALNVEWRVELIGDEPPVGHQPPTLEFRTGGELVGFTGLNRIRGQWSAQGKKVVVSELGGTDVTGPEALTTQDAAYFKALQSIDAWRIDESEPEDRLLLLAGRRTVLTLRKA
jgi:heat shock protein HslJ